MPPYAAANDFAEAGHVRRDAVIGLGSVQGRAETAHDFIENENRAVGLGLAAQGLQERFVRQDQSHIAGHRFDDDGGDIVAEAVHDAVEGFAVVIRQGNRVGSGRSGDAGAVRPAEGGGTGTGADQETVGMAVVAALEFDDFIAARKAAGDAQGTHSGFRAGVDHAQFFYRRIDGSDEPGDFRFEQRRRAVARAAGCRFLQGFDDAGMGVAGNHGTPRTDVIDIGIAVDVGDGRSFGRGDEWRCAVDAAVRTDGAVDAAGHEGLGVLKCSLGMSQCKHG